MVSDGRPRSAIPGLGSVSLDLSLADRPVRVDQTLVYVAQTGAGQETLTPEQFAAKYGWKNDPERVRLTGE